MGLKVFISVDLEGISGVVHSEHTSRAGREHDYARKLMTSEVNAAIEGALSVGADEIIVNDSHGTMRNILIDQLNPKAKLLTGSPKILSMMQGIDSTFDAVFFIGYHAKSGTKIGVLDHTISSKVVSDIIINGVSVGEVGINAGIAGYFGVPVVLVTGDNSVVSEARSLLGDIELVVVKEAVGRYAALCLHPDVVYGRIREAARRALKRLSDFKPFTFSSPVNVEVMFVNSGMAEMAELIPNVKRVDGRKVSFTHEDFLTAFKILRAIIYLASTVA